jgi:hypothetical protein
VSLVVRLPGDHAQPQVRLGSGWMSGQGPANNTKPFQRRPEFMLPKKNPRITCQDSNAHGLQTLTF